MMTTIGRRLAAFAALFGLVAFFAMAAMSGVSAAPKTPTPVPTPTTVPTPLPPKDISAKALGTTTCEPSDPYEWHFVITQVASGGAPASIYVVWSDGSAQTVPLSKVSGGVAHYSAYGPEYTASVLSATTTIYGSWGGQFNLSHVPCRPSVAVSKTANTSFTRTYEWAIDKSVDQSVLDLFSGDSATVNYDVDVTQTGYTDSGWTVSGTITVTNDSYVSATVSSVTDSLGPIDCSGAVLAPGESIVCDYSFPLEGAVDGTNTATATLIYGETFSGSANYAFGEPTTTVNATVNVTDTVEGDLGQLSDTGSFSYSRTFTCDSDEGSHPNTATIVETGQDDSEEVTVNCYELTVTKTANTSLTRTWTWTIEKSANISDATINLGDGVSVHYTVTLGASSVDSAWAVSGTITVNNPAPIDAPLNSVSDVIEGILTPAAVDCGVTFPYTLTAGGTLNCTYSSALPDAADRNNTAAATLQNTPDGTTDFTGTALVSFANAVVTEVDESVDVTDSLVADLEASINAADDDKSIEYDYSTGAVTSCDDFDIDNTATFVTNDTDATDNDSVNIPVIVTCASISITKTAGGNALAGAEFDLLQNGDLIASGITDENGLLTFSGLALGTYTLHETFAPAPWGLVPDEVVDLDEDGETVELVIDDPRDSFEFPVFKIYCEDDPGAVSASNVADGILPANCTLGVGVDFSVERTLADVTETLAKTTGADGGFLVEADVQTSVTITEDITSITPGFEPLVNPITIESVSNPQEGVVFVNVRSALIYGCSPGYYKTHDFTLSNTTMASVGFVGTGTTTFGQAVGLTGGGLNALLRHAASAYLNAYYDLENFPYTTAEVVSLTNAAIASGDYSIQQDFAEYNHGVLATGGCPLN